MLTILFLFMILVMFLSGICFIGWILYELANPLDIAPEKEILFGVQNLSRKQEKEDEEKAVEEVVSKDEDPLI